MSLKMKSRFAWVAAALLLPAALSFMIYAQRPEPKTPFINYLASAKPIRLNRENIPTFVVKPAPLSEDEAMRLAERITSFAKVDLVRTKEPGERLDGRLLFANPKDPSATLDINLRNGDFLFNQGTAAYSKEEETKGLPSEEEAGRLAARHLERLNMLPPRSELVVAHVGGLSLGVHREDGSTSLYRKQVNVRYDRTLADLPVFGDSRVVVRMGEGGDLVGLIRRWSAVDGRKARPDELQTDAAIERAVRDRLLTEGRTATSIVVKYTDLVLYDHGNGVIEPAIHVVASRIFEVNIVNGPTVGEVRRIEVPYDTFIPVLKNHRGDYPFMRDPEAVKYIKSDKPVQLLEREVAQPESNANVRTP
jgi:hypothetical protein